MSLEWASPKDDGNSPLQGYVLEVKPANSSRWKAVSAKGAIASVGEEPIIKDNYITVKDLKPGERFEFRVRAKNELMVGEPCMLAKAVEIKPKVGIYLYSRF